MIRRRPLLRTAVVAGTAGAVVGHQAAKRSAHEAQQDAQMAEMQQQQQQMAYQQQAAQAPAYQPAPPAPASPSGSMDAKAETLTKLKQMLDQGILTQQEFDQQKAKILQS